MAPGSKASTRLQLHNPSPSKVTVRLAGQTSRRIGSCTTVLTTTQDNESNHHPSVPDYLLPIDRSRVPEGTELMVVRAVLPIEEVDPQNELRQENSCLVAVLQHTDWNGDGLLWSDVYGNGVVTHLMQEADEECPECGESPAIDWSGTEIQRWEYGRFAVADASGNSWTVTVHHPLERWRDGLYVAIWHVGGCEEPPEGEPGEPICWGRSEEVPHAHFSLRFDFYAHQDWPWLRLADSALVVPAGSAADVEAQLTVPEGTAPGAYVGAIFPHYDRPAGDAPVETGGGYELPWRRLVIPVNVKVGAHYDWQGTLSLAGAAARDADAPCDNGALRGNLDWDWRPETGDWRFFCVDALAPPPGTFWISRTPWDDLLPGYTDIDAQLWAAAADCAGLNLTSQIPLAGLRALGVGLSQPVVIQDQLVKAGDIFRYRLEVRERAARFDVRLRGEPGVDLDLYLRYDANQNGYFEDQEEIAGSYSVQSDEEISLPGL